MGGNYIQVRLYDFIDDIWTEILKGITNNLVDFICGTLEERWFEGSYGGLVAKLNEGNHKF